MTVFPALLGQQCPQGFQSLLGVDHTGGVIGGVDQHRLGVGREHGRYGIQLDLKLRHIRGNHPKI